MSETTERTGEPLGNSPSATLHRDQRRDQVAALLAAGFRSRQIASQLGVPRTTVRRDIAVIHRYWRARAEGSYGDWIAAEVGKLDAVERAVLVRAMRGDLGAVDRWVKLAERRSKLLGLDAPAQHKIEVLTEDVLDRAIAELNAEMADVDARLAAGDADHGA